MAMHKLFLVVSLFLAIGCCNDNLELDHTNNYRKSLNCFKLNSVSEGHQELEALTYSKLIKASSFHSLNLSDCNISTIKGKSFIGFKTLKCSDLSNNSITLVFGKNFHLLSNLKSVLNSSELFMIPEEAFSQLIENL
jgi:hypothetical protein